MKIFLEILVKGLLGVLMFAFTIGAARLVVEFVLMCWSLWGKVLG